MNDNDFEKVIERIKKESVEVVNDFGKKCKNEAEKDALKLIDKIEQNLKTWTMQLAEGELTEEDFEFLVMGQKELIEMYALKHAGYGKIKMEELKTALMNLIIRIVIETIK